MMIKAKIGEYLKKAVNGKISAEIFTSENEKFGHYSTNAALKLANLEKENPLAVAEKIVNSLNAISPKNFFEKIEIAGPGFLNFWLSSKTIGEELKQTIKLGNGYGGSKTGKNKTIIIDYSAPNVAKPMNVGHLRSTLIGNVLANLFSFEGYKVVSDNHIGDWGTQFGSLIAAWKKWGNKKDFNKDPIDYLVKLYVRFHKAAEKNEKLMDAAREETKKLQSGDSENKKLWRLFTKESLENFSKAYKRLNVKFSHTLGESFYQPLLAPIVQEALQKKVAESDDGAIKILYGDSLPALVIRKSDGAHLYSTTDLATVKYRMKKWNPEKIFYVVANEQTLHFNQVFAAAARLGYAGKNVLEHVKFGMILGESGKKMSTRRGEFIKLDELLDKAVSKSAKINKKAGEDVGIGAIKYRVLSHELNSDIVFDWDQMLNLKGNSGPYIQYAYSRLKSVLHKAGALPKKPDFLLLETESEKSVMRQLVYFPEILSRAMDTRQTNILTEYLLKLTNTLNYFYEKENILKSPKLLRENRLNLIRAGAIVLKNGLNLLGVKALEKM